MRSNAEGKMNVARPSAVFRAGAWGGLLAYSLLVYYVSTHIYERASDGMSEFGLSFVPIIAFFLYAIVITHEVYRWDDKEIWRRVLWRQSSMRWEEITRFDVRRFGGSCVLTDAEGRRLIVRIFILGPDPPLQRVLIEKLARLEEHEQGDFAEAVKAIEASGESRFQVEVGQGSFLIRSDLLLRKRRGKTTEIPLSEVKTVYQRGLKASWCTILETRGGERVRIPAYTRGYNTLIAYVRARATDAVWVNLGGPEPAEPRAKAVYLNGRIRMSYESRAAARLLLPVAAIVAVVVVARLAWSITHDIALLSSFWVLYTMLVQGISLTFVSALAVQNLRHNARELRDLQVRLAALEAEKDGEGATPAVREDRG